MRILVLNGPNLNLLGKREPDIYGNRSYATLCRMIEEKCEKESISVEIRQTNHEGVLVDWIQEALDTFDAIVFNPAAYTHTSVAILDALKAVAIPCVEVHISDVPSREAFRQISFVREVCVATITGHGFDGYLEAIDLLKKRLA